MEQYVSMPVFMLVRASALARACACARVRACPIPHEPSIYMDLRAHMRVKRGWFRCHFDARVALTHAAARWGMLISTSCQCNTTINSVSLMGGTHDLV